MPIQRSEIKKLVYKALIEGVRRNGERIFNTSQNTEGCFVPVNTGTLKKSGYTKNLPNGIEIGYTAPYAARVEAGGPAIPYSGTQVVHVQGYTRRGYTRRYRKDEPRMIYVSSGSVKAHDRVYVEKRLVGFRPKFSKFERGPLIFRLMKEQPAQEGQRFLGRAVEREILYLPEDLSFYLKRLENL